MAAKSSSKPKVVEQAYEIVSVDAVRPHPRNVNEGNIDAIAASMRANGFYGALRVQRSSGHICAGNHSWRAAKEIGLKQVPVIYLDITDDQALRIMLADNQTAREAHNREQELADLLGEIQLTSDGLLGTGFDDGALDDLLKRLGDSALAGAEAAGGDPVEEEEEPQVDRAEELLAKWKVQPGQIWQIGKHRLMCGDSTDAAAVARLTQGEKADMVFTDPPFNVAVVGGTHDPRDAKNFGVGPKIQNDSMPDADFRKFLIVVFVAMREVLKDGAAVYVAHSDKQSINFQSAFLESGLLLKQCLIWAKQHFVFGRSDYHYQHEAILYGWKPGAAHNFYGEHNQGTVWNIDRPMRSDKEHPTQKPVALVVKAILNSSKSGELLFEPFGGSGTTMVACEQTKRICRSMELEPKYCAVILERMEKLGLTPELASDPDVPMDNAA